MRKDGAMWDALWLEAHLATMDPAVGDDDYGTLRDGAVGVADGRIAWVGRRADLPGEPAALARQVHRAGGRWITPGLIDCHTHLVYGGDRAAEFALRLKGASYEEIARAGGGILSTVAATRAADAEALYAAARRRLDTLRAEGVTTVEIKSGYGLDVETELKMLRVAGRLGAETGMRVRRSFLGAHALPPEFKGDGDGYIDLVCRQMLPLVAVEKLADAVDAFGEKIAFSPRQVARVFEAATELGLPVKLHADQLSDQGGGALAAEYRALSADHLEYLSEAGAKAMAAAGTVAVLLPGAFYFLGETRRPPIDLLRRHGVPMAVATDCNPGSSPATSLLLMLNMACTLFRLTAEEALAGVTRNAAAALGLEDECGRLAPGLAADFVLWDIAVPAELSYRISFNPCAGIVRAGGS
ncbi:MAG: imidazolonepropionase [Inquilinus sp.]|nr:imidazolonepropionase [Inquilinus sp.]